MLWLNRHARFRNNLSPYIDGRLSPDELRALETHLDGCDACRRELDELRAMASAMRDLPQADTPRSFALTPAMLERRTGAPATYAPPLAAGMRLASAAVAVALTIVVIGDLSGTVGNGDDRSGGGLESRTTAQLESGEVDEAGGDAAQAEAPAAEEYGEDTGTDDRGASPSPVIPPEDAFAACPDTGAAGGSAGTGGVGGPASGASPTPAPATPGPTAVSQPDTACAVPVGEAQPTPAPGVVEALRDAEPEAAEEADATPTDGDGVSTLLALEIVLGVALVALLAGTIVEFALRRRSRQ